MDWWYAWKQSNTNDQFDKLTTPLYENAFFQTLWKDWKENRKDSALRKRTKAVINLIEKHRGLLYDYQVLKQIQFKQNSNKK